MISDPPRLDSWSLAKIYPTPKASNLINKEKTDDDNEPTDTQVKVTYQLIMKPTYPRLLQLKLKSMYFKKSLTWNKL